MATKTFEELKQLAIQIRDEKTNKQNTATRIGTQMLEHLDKLEQDYYDKTATDEELKERDEKLTELEGKTEEIKNTKQDTLTFDEIPTLNSNNPVTSGGIREALDSQKKEVDAAKEEALNAISESESSAISNFSSQKVTPEMLSQGVKDLINTAGGGTINNMPDEEDIQSVSDGTGGQVLKFNNRYYNPSNFSGKGYKILRKNIVDGKNVLTQDMINEANTVYEIRYDYDLNGEEITIPEECILKFEGGSLMNGILRGNQTVISADKYTIFYNINFNDDKQQPSAGYGGRTWCIDYVYPEWFGAKRVTRGFIDNDNFFSKNTDSSEAIQKSFDLANQDSVIMLSGKYLITKKVVLNDDIPIFGVSPKSSGLIYCGTDDCALEISPIYKEYINRGGLKNFSIDNSAFGYYNTHYHHGIIKGYNNLSEALLDYSENSKPIKKIKFYTDGTSTSTKSESAKSYIYKGGDWSLESSWEEEGHVSGIKFSDCLIGTHFINLHITNFSGYAIATNGYVQEAEFIRIDAKGSSGIIGFSDDFDYYNALSSYGNDLLYNVVRFSDIYMDCVGQYGFKGVHTLINLYSSYLVEINNLCIQGPHYAVTNKTNGEVDESIIDVSAENFKSNLTLRNFWLEVGSGKIHKVVVRKAKRTQQTTLNIINGLPINVELYSDADIYINNSIGVYEIDWLNIKDDNINFNVNVNSVSERGENIFNILKTNGIGNSSLGIFNDSYTKKCNVIFLNSPYLKLRGGEYIYKNSKTIYTSGTASSIIDNDNRIVTYIDNFTGQQLLTLSNQIFEAKRKTTVCFVVYAKFGWKDTLEEDIHLKIEAYSGANNTLGNVSLIRLYNQNEIILTKNKKESDFEKIIVIYSAEFPLQNPNNAVGFIRLINTLTKSSVHNNIYMKIKNINICFDAIDLSDDLSERFLSQGTFNNKPYNSPIGFAFFCTDKQTAEGSTNGIMIYHKGNNVWVDALGRVVE